ncbi:MAG: biotin--[acetyl-CoA-carboxylase] ligase [Bdellovibrionales bacterium]
MIAWRIRQLAETVSANDDAKHAAEAGEPEGLVIWALRQTAGRGRRERKWETGQGNLACSLLLRPAQAAKSYGAYSFVAALSVRDVVSEKLKGLATTPPPVTLKWPNDVLVRGKKVSGIMLEAGSDWLVVGVGVNVLNHPENPAYPATSLREEATVQEFREPLNKILERLLDQFNHWATVLNVEGFAPIRAAWLEHAQKGPMTVKLGADIVKGDFRDLDETGALRLRLENGAERAISAGDVYFGAP